MLVLSRKKGETLCIGDNICVHVVSVSGGRVKIGIEAPDGCRILRGELASWTDESLADTTSTEGSCLAHS